MRAARATPASKVPLLRGLTVVLGVVCYKYGAPPELAGGCGRCAVHSPQPWGLRGEGGAIENGKWQMANGKFRGGVGIAGGGVLRALTPAPLPSDGKGEGTMVGAEPRAALVPRFALGWHVSPFQGFWEGKDGGAGAAGAPPNGPPGGRVVNPPASSDEGHRDRFPRVLLWADLSARRWRAKPPWGRLESRKQKLGGTRGGAGLGWDWASRRAYAGGAEPEEGIGRSPSPRPTPPGEGEALAAFVEIDAPGCWRAFWAEGQQRDNCNRGHRAFKQCPKVLPLPSDGRGGDYVGGVTQGGGPCRSGRDGPGPGPAFASLRRGRLVCGTLSGFLGGAGVWERGAGGR
jgi:hypothetical protein